MVITIKYCIDYHNYFDWTPNCFDNLEICHGSIVIGHITQVNSILLFTLYLSIVFLRLVSLSLMLER